MTPILQTLTALVQNLFRPRLAMQMEILALHHQLTVYERTCARPRLKPAERLLWSWLSRVWADWQDALVFVKPETVIAWRRRRFRAYWARLSRSGQPGRQSTPREVRDLIRRISASNPLWGAPRIVGELRMIGLELPKSTVAKYMVRRRKPPSTTWRAFLKNHIRDIVAVDFFVVPTVRNQILFVFLILADHRRRVLHFNVTECPTAEWTAQQIVNAFPWDSAPRFLLRDRDRIYGEYFFLLRPRARTACQPLSPGERRTRRTRGILRRARRRAGTNESAVIAIRERGRQPRSRKSLGPCGI